MGNFSECFLGIFFWILCWHALFINNPIPHQSVAVSIEKYNELKEKYEELEQKYYFDMRNKQIEIEVLKTQINKG